MLASIGILLLLGLSALGDPNRADQLKTQAQRDLSAANYHFSIALFRRLVEQQKNLLVSGISVSTVLSMLLSGSDGQTYRELASTLKYTNLTRLDLHGAYPGILSALQGNGSYDLSLANSVWAKPSYPVLEEYQNIVRSTYNAEYRQLNLESSKADINAWVNEKTHGMIPEMLKEELSRDTVMTLFNAVFFEGKWAKPFSDYTFEGKFLNNDLFIADKPRSTTEMMFTSGEFNYTEDRELGATLLDLPYEGDEVSMTIVLPMATLFVLENTLTPFKLQQAINKMTRKSVDVTMPVFSIENELNLNSHLQALGIKEVFGDNADLSHISHSRNIKVSEVFQKAKIEVTKEGTKASASTGVVIETNSIKISEINFRANRPFLFLLRHRPTNTLLFAGRYTDATPFRK